MDAWKRGCGDGVADNRMSLYKTSVEMARARHEEFQERRKWVVAVEFPFCDGRLSFRLDEYFG